MFSFKKLDELLDKFVAMGIPAFDIEIRYQGEKVYRRMHGYSDYEKKIPLNGTELYNIYSCSKPITCCAAMTLFEKGKFSLEDKLSDYLPEFENMKILDGETLRDAVRPIRIIDLFTMSAGFTYDLRSKNFFLGRSETDGAETREIMKYLARDPLAFDPSERYHYSLCHDVIAALVQVIADEKFGDYVKRVIFDKAGMNNTSYLLTEENKKRLCAQYRFNDTTKEFEPIPAEQCGYRVGPKYESGGAGCISSVDDYIAFSEALRTHAILSPKTVDLISASHLSMSQMVDYGLKDIGYGCGLGVRCPLDAESPSTDIGWGGAAAAYFACDRKHGFSLYYAQHVLSSPNQNMRTVLPSLVRQALGCRDGATKEMKDGNKVTY